MRPKSGMVAGRLITADVRLMSWSSRIVIKGEEEEVILESTDCGNPDTVPLTICAPCVRGRRIQWIRARRTSSDQTERPHEMRE